jgi:SAM-dependent methyltransferase
MDTAAGPEKNFRFYDNRQKYLMFVNTCSEKRVVAERVVHELSHIRPRPPAVRLFDAGVGDGTVLARVMRGMHQRFETLPFYIVGKEISLEDVRLTLEKLPDRFHEHPATVLILTNLYYSEAPWLVPASPATAARLVWHEVALQGRTSAEFEQQINALEPFLARHWRASVSRKSGNPVYEEPVVLVLYLESQRFLLNQVIPRRGAIIADYDLVIASQPYRARASAAFKAAKVIAPLARSLAPGGRLLGIHSCGGDPGLEIVQAVWPGEMPFTTDRHDILRETRLALGSRARRYKFHAQTEAKARFQYQMYTLPDEIESGGASIGTSTLLAAWNNAIYVAQVEDERLAEAMSTSGYLERTRDILRKHGRLWFNDESYVISRGIDD